MLGAARNVGRGAAAVAVLLLGLLSGTALAQPTTTPHAPPPALPASKGLVPTALTAPVLPAPVVIPDVPQAPPAPKSAPTFASVCSLIETAAKEHGLPTEFFTRLVWQESRFRPDAVSPAGAQGIAQFMPMTALERDLIDPFNPGEAIPASAAFLADLRRRFGNLGLAAAAYNGGPARVEAWLAGRGGLPFETRDYVEIITGRIAEDWRGGADEAPAIAKADAELFKLACGQVVAVLQRPGGRAKSAAAKKPVWAPWGVQVAGHFSQGVALKMYAAQQRRFGKLIGSAEPMVIGGRNRSRGSRAIYNVRVPAPSRDQAASLCAKLKAAGGTCVVMRTK